ncbi:MAG: hypothetical protein ACRDKT_09005 [Actinomycetota bacterium]
MSRGAVYDRQVASPGARDKATIDPLRYCIFTTIALVAWVLGPAVAVMLMSALGLLAYGRAYRAGLRESRCLLRHVGLVFGYLGAAFVAAAYFVSRDVLALLG